MKTSHRPAPGALRRWGPGAAGWLVTMAVPGLFDWWATTRRPQRPTMSRTLGHFLAQPVVGPLLAGIFCGLGYHLFVNEALICWQERLDARAAVRQ